MSDLKTNSSLDEKEPTLSKEELNARRDEITAFYKDNIEHLEIQAEYEMLLATIEKARAERMQAQMFMAQQYAEIAVSSSKNYDLSDRQSDLLVSEHIITTLEKNGTIKTLEQRKWFMNFYLVYLSGSSGGVQYFV